MHTSKNPQTSETQLEIDRAPNNLRCLMVVAARSTTSRVKQGPLWGMEDSWGQGWQIYRDKPPTMMTHCLALAENLPWIVSFPNMFYCDWIEEMSLASPFENICESWQQLNLSSELGREIWVGLQGLWACVYLYSCTLGTVNTGSVILKFSYEIFWSMISKEEDQFTTTLEKSNWYHRKPLCWLHIIPG